MERETAVMKEIEIVQGVSPEYATRALEYYRERYLIREPCVSEIYCSPDFTKALSLKYLGEQRFGFSYFSGKVCHLERGRVPGKPLRSFRFRRILSPGAFGCGYDHWSGSPWSPDSEYVALAETTGRNLDAFRIRVVSCSSGKSTTLMKSRDVLSHHMWSSMGDCLFKNTTTWYLYSCKNGEVRTACAGKSYPRHCHFEHSGANMILLDDELMLRLLACDSLETITAMPMKERLRGGKAINFSMVDPFENQVLLAVDAEFDEVACSDTWLAVKITS